MKKLLGCGLGLALGLAVTSVHGQELSWRTGTTPPTAASESTAAPRRAVTLGRPMPNAGEEPSTPAANAAPARPSLSKPTPLVRAKADEDLRPLPQGPALTEPKNEEIKFKPSSRPELVPAPTAQSKPAPMAPADPEPERIPNQPRLVPHKSRSTQPVPQVIQNGTIQNGVIHNGTIIEDGTVIENGTIVESGRMSRRRPYHVYPTPVTDACDCGSAGPIWEGDQGGMIVDGDCGCPTMDCCTPCGDCCMDGCCMDGCCYPRGRAWIRGEYLLWTFKTPGVPPLVTTSSVATNPGILGQPGTETIYGGDDFNNIVRSGGRITAGFWFPNHDDWGVEVSGFFIHQRNNSFAASSGGLPILGRPLIDATTLEESVELVAFPGLLAGSVRVDYLSRLWGAEINLKKKLHCGPNYHVDLLAGYRHLDLDESININEDLLVLAGSTAGLGIKVQDHFGTRNKFDGGQIGLEGEYRFLKRMFIGGQVKVAIGNVNQVVNITGSTTFLPPGGLPPQTVGSGVFATTTNIGSYERNRFAVVPEGNLKVGVDITEQLRIFVGYNFLYLSTAMRPGNAIDRTINTTQLPVIDTTTFAASPGTLVGPARPTMLFKGSDFWAQGFNAGLEYHW